tara:strand:+ start:850 stop:1092 length:243 start_codon:yes stop_codon:yes gene_type:complete
MNVAVIKFMEFELVYASENSPAKVNSKENTLETVHSHFGVTFKVLDTLYVLEEITYEELWERYLVSCNSMYFMEAIGGHY